MAAGANWEPNRRSDLFDGALAAVMAVAAGVSLYIGSDPLLSGDLADYHGGLGITLLVMVIAPLTLRRRYPLTVLTVMAAAFVPLQLLEIPESIMSVIAMFIGIYTVGAYGGPRRHLVRGVVAAALLGMVAWSLTFDIDDYEGRVPIQLIQGYNAFQVVFFLAAAWVLGDLVSTRREREATLEAQAGQLRDAQAERATQAVLEERVRIARELHDVVAHHVSVMGVQAGAARRVLDRQPDAVPELLESVEESSRQAVAELQRMLGLLRRDEVGSGNGVRDPQPTLAQLGQLADQMRHAGLDVTTAVEGDTAGLPASVDLSAFRIVQEALTNTLKHAGPGASADVSVVRRDGSLEVAVADNGTGSVAGGGQGHGLLGMQERVGSLGGELRIEQRLGQGFSVRVWLPLVAQGEPA